MTFQFIRDHREHFPVRLMCRVLEASPSGFYDWLRRPESQRAAEDRALVEKIQAVHNESRRTYGSPRVHASLKAAGYRIGRKREQRMRCSADARERHSGQGQAQVQGHH
jgi:putative transposase